LDNAALNVQGSNCGPFLLPDV